MIPEIWPYSRGLYKVYTEDYQVMKKIASWEGCKKSGIYYNHYGQVFGWDLIFPGYLYNRIAKSVGLPPRKKNPNRINHGKKLGRLAKKKDFLGIQK